MCMHTPVCYIQCLTSPLPSFLSHPAQKNGGSFAVNASPNFVNELFDLAGSSEVLATLK